MCDLKLGEKAMDPQLPGQIIFAVISGIIGLLVGTILGEPLQRWWQNWLDMKTEIANILSPRYRFNVLQLQDPNAPEFNFSRRIKDQNDCQRLFLFEIEESLRAVSGEAVTKIADTNSKKSFVDNVGRLLADARNESWNGLSDKPSDKRRNRRRDIVITNLPLPGNFYGWNSKDRTLLVISTAPSQYILEPGGELTVDDFVVRILQRMAVFAITPRIDPRRDHIRKSVGCLFDFTVFLSNLGDILGNCNICPDCCRLIAQDHGDYFALRVREWVEALGHGSHEFPHEKMLPKQSGRLT
jgi:hypothetical protein